MAQNPYIRDVNNEQNLLEDLNAEFIRALGRNCYYIPRSLNNYDPIYGEDTASSFDQAYLIEMYMENPQSFGGDGDIIGKFGIDLRDKATFRIATRTFEREVTKRDSNIIRPREGDLIYYVLSDSLFEITFVEHENPLYQLGNLYSFLAFSELFAYNNEEFNTGICEVDECFARARKELAQIITTGAPTRSTNTVSEFFEGETVFQVGNTYGEYTNIDEATATAQVINWDSETLQLTLGNISGSFVASPTTSAIKGTESNAERFVGGTGNADFFNQINSESETLQGDNEDLQLEVEKDDLIDFSDKDPFSGGNF
tara:strand:- start:1161 stop:2102 length:942 start_codon:yes stop_codon:yes gene_type:complete